MASINETKKALESYLATNWTTTAIKWPNVNFAPRKDSSGNPLPYIVYVQHETEWPGGSDITLGAALPSRWFRWAGILVNEVYVPENYADAGLMTRYLGQLTDLWTRRLFTYNDSNGNQSFCRMRVPYATDIGIIEGWYRQYLTVPYRRDSQS